MKSQSTPETIPPQYGADEFLADCYRQGWNRGHGIACHNVPTLGDKICPSIDWIGLGRTITPENIREYHEQLCFAAESGGRDFSPFEFTAKRLNDHEDSESAWEAYDEGIGDAIRADLSTYTDADYGIEKGE